MPLSIMILGAGPLQVPAIHEAAALGIRSVALDRNPQAAGLRLCDAPHVVNIMDSEAVTAIARVERIDGIMTLCTDAPVRTVAAVASVLGLPALSLSAAAKATDKRLMRSALSARRVPIPRFSVTQTLDEARLAADSFGYPLALKIGCSSGSRGVYRVDSQADLAARFVQAREFQPLVGLLLEEWMEGDEVSVEGACWGKEIHVVQVTDKLLFPGVFPVEAGHSQPSRLPEASVASIRATAEAGVHALELTDSAFHAELKMTRGGPKIVEIGARLGGDRIATHLTPLSTGVNLLKAAISIAVGHAPDLASARARGSAVRYFHASGCGTIERVEGLDEVQTMPGLELLYSASERDGPLRPGLVVGEIRSSLDRYGHAIFSGDDAAHAFARAEQAARTVRFHFNPSA